MIALPSCRTLALQRHDGPLAGRLDVWLDRPEVRNAMSMAMVDELEAVFDAIAMGEEFRVVVIRGRGGHFCAGGDVKDMAAARAAGPGADGVDPLARINRRYGSLVARVDRAPQAVVVALEGAVMGGGLGLVCAADVVLATADARLRLPEATIGIPPAQLAPFLVRRLGSSVARYLAVTAATVDGREAAALGLVHRACADEAELTAATHDMTLRVLRCAPGAIRDAKEIIASVDDRPFEAVLDDAAARFAAAVRGPEGVEGMTAFLQKRRPSWAPEDDS